MKIKANAKINFSLSVCGKRDDGYHLIDTVMHSIGLYDTVFIEKTDTISVICGDMPQEDNIAFKAANLFFEKTGVSGGCDIKIIKNIPLSAGLGGGSADAAAVLVGLNKLYNAGLSYENLCDLAVKLGADVPFFIKGGCMRSEGIGEILTPKKPLEEGYILLAKAETKPSTAEMYKQIDSKETVLADTNAVLSAISENDLENLSKNLYNAFEAVWQDSVVKQELLKTDAKAVALTGSGPTWFAIFETPEEIKLAERVLKEKNIPVWVCVPKQSSLEFE